MPPARAWLRIGVHHFAAHGLGADIHPRVRVLCGASQMADLGPRGFYSPSAPDTFAPTDGEGAGPHRFWLAADVAWAPDGAGGGRCIVRPLHADATARTPLLLDDVAAAASFGPPYLPAPAP